MRYTTEIIADIVSKYQAKIEVEKIALDYKVPPRSIIAKLSQLGVYQRQVYRNKQGEVPQPKQHLIDQLAGLLELPADNLASLSKVNKYVLKKLIKHLI